MMPAVSWRESSVGARVHAHPAPGPTYTATALRPTQPRWSHKGTPKTRCHVAGPVPIPTRPGAGSSDVRATDSDDLFDLVVIGGGIIGSGIARDAALRGARVALVEMNDLAWGTTARSTRLVHGGLRYLEHFDLALVKEALRERKTLIRMAPHLVKPLSLLLPKFKRRGRPKWMLRIGLVMYDTLARRNIGYAHRWWSRDRVIAKLPVLDRPDLMGAFEFFDAQVAYPERLVVENALDLMARGGTVLTHTEVIGLEAISRGSGPDGRHQVRARDALTGDEITLVARLVVNTSGPWVTQVDSRLGSADPALTRRTKGVHILCDPIAEHAMLVQCADGKRIFFVIPWEGFSLIGTTDTDYAGANETVHAEAEDVRYLLDEVNANLHVDLRPEDLHATYAGLRPLIHQEHGTAGAVSRRHLIVDHDRGQGPRGLVTVVGGKITSFRAIAEHVVDAIFDRVLPAQARMGSTTATEPLPGGRPLDETALRRRLGATLPHLSDDDTERLLSLYGARTEDLVAFAARKGLRLGHIHPAHRLTWEEARFAVEVEGARTLEDVLLRRTMVGYDRGGALGLAPPLAAEMAGWLGWSGEHTAAEIAAHAASFHRNRESIDALVGRYTPRPADVRIGKRIKRRQRRRASAVPDPA